MSFNRRSKAIQCVFLKRKKEITVVVYLSSFLNPVFYMSQNEKRKEHKHSTETLFTNKQNKTNWGDCVVWLQFLQWKQIYQCWRETDVEQYIKLEKKQTSTVNLHLLRKNRTLDTCRSSGCVTRTQVQIPVESLSS